MVREVLLWDRGGVSIIPDWPFAPGQGPFRVKGSSYRGHQAFMDEHVPGGFAGMVERISPELQEFYTSQTFLPSGWYDLAPLVAVAEVGGEAMGMSAMGYVAIRARAQVDQDIRGVYGFLAKLVSGRTIAVRLPRLIALYFDFVETNTRVVADNQVITEHLGIPRALAPWITTVASAYLERLLTLTKGVEPRVVVSPFRDAGEAHGVPVVGFDVDVLLG